MMNCVTNRHNQRLRYIQEHTCYILDPHLNLFQDQVNRFLIDTKIGFPLDRGSEGLVLATHGDNTVYWKTCDVKDVKVNGVSVVEDNVAYIDMLIQEAIAPIWSGDHTTPYSMGDYVIHNNRLYKRKNNEDPSSLEQEWVDANWEEIAVADEFYNIYNNIEDVNNNSIFRDAQINSRITTEVETIGQRLDNIDSNINVINERIEHIDDNTYTKTEVDNKLDLKVDKVAGKGLSTNDYTDADKTKLNGIAAGAEVNVQSDWTEANISSDSYIKNKPTIPTALSQLSDDSTHRLVTDTEKDKIVAAVTNTVDNLVNYYTKTQSYNKTEVNDLLNTIKLFEYIVVASLPTASASTMQKIYLVPASSSVEGNIKDEYITLQNGSIYSWEKIGSTSIDLSNYYTKAQTDTAIATALNSALSNYVTSSQLSTTLANYQPKLTSANQGSNVTITEVGGIVKINATGGSSGTTDYNELSNKPKINDVEVTGNKPLSDYGIASHDEVVNKSKVEWNQITPSTSGTKIATITIDNTPTDVYAPTSGGGGGEYNILEAVKVNDTALPITDKAVNIQSDTISKGVDTTVTSGSSNLPTSGAVATAISNATSSSAIQNIVDAGNYLKHNGLLSTGAHVTTVEEWQFIDENGDSLSKRIILW